MRIGLGLGLGARVGVSGGPPLGAAFWASGGYFDLRSVEGGLGAAAPGTIAATAGPASLTSIGGPVISGHGIAGGRCVYLDGSTQYLRCDALAALFSGSDKPGSIFIRYRSIGSGTQALVSCGNSAGATDNFLQLRASTLQAVDVRKDAAAETTIARTGTVNLKFDEHTIVLSTDGAAVSVWVDGVADTLDSSGLNSASITTDRGAVGALLANTASQFLHGYVQAFGFSSEVATGAQAAAFDAALRAGDFCMQKSASPKVAWAGDSIMQGSTGNNAGGYRDWIGDFRDYNKLSLDFVGQYTAGLFPDSEHSSLGGAGCATIANNVNADVDAASGVDLLFFFGGTNDVDDTAPVALTAYAAALTSIRTNANGWNPDTIIYVGTLIPIGSPQAGFDQWETFNAGLAAIWNASDAAFPGMPALRRVDFAAAFGGAYNAANYDVADLVHPNSTGYALMGAALVAACRTDLLTLSPTLATLAANILSPSAGATFVQGDVGNVAGVVTRTTCTGLVRDDQGDSWGAITFASADGSIPNQTWSRAYTPVAGDVGYRVIHAEVLDAVTAGEADSSTVAVTVEAPSTSFADLGTLVGWWDLSDASSYTQNGTSVTALTNKATGIGATEATAPPNYEATGGPGGHPCMTGVGASSHKLVSAADAAMAFLVGSQKPYTWIGWVKLTGLNATAFMFGVGGSATANQGMMVGQQTTNKYRNFRQDAAANTSNILPATPATAAGWHLLAFRFDGTNNYFSLNGGAETTTASPLAGSIAGCNRWGFFCRPDSSPDTFGSGSVGGDTVLYSNDIGAVNLAIAIALAQARAA